MFDFTPPPALVEMGLAVAPGYSGIRDAVTVLALRSIGEARGAPTITHSEGRGVGMSGFVEARAAAAARVSDAMQGVDIYNLETGNRRGVFGSLAIDNYDGRLAIHHGTGIDRSSFGLGDEPVLVTGGYVDGVRACDIFPQLRPRMGPLVALAAIQAVADRLRVSAQTAALALCGDAIRSDKPLLTAYTVNEKTLTISYRGQLRPMVLDLSAIRDGDHRGRRVLSSR